jgi:rubrerythrin
MSMSKDFNFDKIKKNIVKKVQSSSFDSKCRKCGAAMKVKVGQNVCPSCGAKFDIKPDSSWDNI